MTLISSLLLSLLVCLMATLCESDVECGIRNSGQRIIGGTKSPSVWPWMAGLVRKGTSELPFCGATIISPKYLLTAAHCLFATSNRRELEMSSIFVGVGKTDIKETKKHHLKKITKHPDYDKNKNYFDIAILELEHPLDLDGEKVAPVCLPEQNDNLAQNGADAMIMGWGKEENTGGNTIKDMKEGHVKIVDTKHCAADYEKASEGVTKGIPDGLNHNFTCAEGTHANTCKGDSGGPLLVSQTGKWIQVGIVSFGEGCAKRNFPTVFTLVSAFRHFIKQQTGS